MKDGVKVWWEVLSPEYTHYSTSPYEPDEHGCRDYVAVEAVTKSEAIRLGVKQMLAERMEYVMSQRIDNCSPYTGITAQIMPDYDADIEWNVPELIADVFSKEQLDNIKLY